MENGLKKNVLILSGKEIVKSGIEGLDVLLDGGFDPGSIVLLAGPPGSGKSIMAAQFIYKGAVNYGEAGLYVSFSEGKGDFFRNMAKLGMDFQLLEEEGKFRFIDAYNVFNRRSLDIVLSHMLDEITLLRVKRIAVDSVSAILGMMQREELKGFMAASIIGICKVNGITCMLIGDMSSRGASEELIDLSFMCDAVLRLETRMLENIVERFLTIEKARGRRILVSRAEYIITDNGVIVFSPNLNHLAERRLDGEVGIGQPDFDRLVLMGGVRRGSITLISGPGGVGKRVLLVEFVASGLVNGEKCLYITFNDVEAGVKDGFKNRGYDLRMFEGMLKILSIPPFMVTPGKVLLALKEALEFFRPKRVVVEGISEMKWLPEEEYRRLVSEMASLFKSYDVTVMMSSTEDILERRHADEFRVADNAIAIWSERRGEKVAKMVCALKMKGREYEGKIRSISYEGGVKVFDMHSY